VPADAGRSSQIQATFAGGESDLPEVCGRSV
jgi:hypothetical protein